MGKVHLSSVEGLVPQKHPSRFKTYGAKQWRRSEAFRTGISVCQLCANSPQLRDTVKYRENIDLWEIRVNQHRKELSETEENKLFEIRD